MNKLLVGTSILLTFMVMLSNQSCKNNDGQNTFKFVQMCDPQLGMGGYEHDTIAFTNAIEQINQLNPDFVVICGDLVDSACNESFNDFIRIKSKFRIRVYLAAGNHDVENMPTKKSLVYYRTKIGKDYYSFEYHGYKFIIVNTQLWKSPLKDETEEHDRWFLKTLANAKKNGMPVFVVGHFPLFVERPDEEENYFNLPIRKRLDLLDLYKKYGVIAHLGGHVHKTLIHNIEGIQFVNGETTSLNFDNRALGFRLWTVNKGSMVHELIELAIQPDEETWQFRPDYQTQNSDTL